MIGRPTQMVVGWAMNLLVNCDRAECRARKRRSCAQRAVRKAKTIVLDLHYDPVTGKRRSVVPAAPDHVIEAPFFENKSEIFPPG